MTSVLLALFASGGAYLLLTPGTSTAGPSLRAWNQRVQLRLQQAGLEGVSTGQFVVVSIVVGAAGTALTVTVVGVGLPALVVGLAAACAPGAAWRRRRRERKRVARESWPQLIEELRVLSGSAGRPIPQALLEVGMRGPVELRPAFRAAQREWALTTDFPRTVAVLKAQLDDPGADAICETLLIAAEVAGDADQRLAALAEDRRADLRQRKEAAARQAGARLARAFVIVVPAGMAAAGLSVGDGAAAYRSPQGQLLVAAAIALVVVCWWWAARIMRLPEPERVFDR